MDAPHRRPSKLIDYAIVQKPILNVHPTEVDKEIVLEFLKGDYHNAFVVDNVEQYHIENVVKKFLNLV